MAYAQFISTDYVFTYTTIPNDVSPQIINKFIRKSQDIEIQGYLGETLYFKLMNDFATTGGYTASYYTLMNTWVKPCLAEYVVYHSLPSIYLSITNKSLVLKTSDYSQPATLKEMEFMRTEFLNSAEYYGERIREFILNNQQTLPEYWQTTGIDRITPRQNNYNSGIYTPRNNNWLGNYPIDYGANPDNWPGNHQ